MTQKTYKMKNALPEGTAGSRDVNITFKYLKLMCAIGNKRSLKMAAQNPEVNMPIATAYSAVRDMKERFQLKIPDSNKRCFCKDVLNFLMQQKVIVEHNQVYFIPIAVSAYFDEVQPELPLVW